MTEAFAEVPRRGVAWLLLVAGEGATTLSLVDILSAWPGGVSDSLLVCDGPSIVHVLDLALALPVLAAIVLVNMLTMGLALHSMKAFIVASTSTPDPAEPALWRMVVAVALAWLVVGAWPPNSAHPRESPTAGMVPAESPPSAGTPQRRIPRGRRLQSGTRGRHAPPGQHARPRSEGPLPAGQSAGEMFHGRAQLPVSRRCEDVR